MTATQERRERQAAEKAAAVNVKDLVFSEEGPPKEIYEGPRYSPYADIVRTLEQKPGKWARIPKAASKAGDIHKKFPGVQRTSQDGDLWLRYVTVDILTDEAVADYGVNGVKAAQCKPIFHSAIRLAGRKSHYFVLDMFRAGKDVATRLRNGEDLTEQVKAWDAEFAELDKADEPDTESEAPDDGGDETGTEEE